MSLSTKVSAIDERSAPLAGIGLMLLGIFLFSFGDALGKFLVGTYSVGQLLWLRACAALVLLFPVIWRQRTAFLSLERPWLQLLRVTLSTIEVAAFFLATVYLPLADVITYYLACPIFVTALSGIVLREKIGWRRWSAVLIGFCGVLIALKPSANTVSWPALIALAGSTSFAFLMLITRSLRATPDIVLASTQFIGTFTLGALMAPFGWVALVGCRQGRANFVALNSPLHVVGCGGDRLPARAPQTEREAVAIGSRCADKVIHEARVAAGRAGGSFIEPGQVGIVRVRSVLAAEGDEIPLAVSNLRERLHPVEPLLDRQFAVGGITLQDRAQRRGDARDVGQSAVN